MVYKYKVLFILYISYSYTFSGKDQLHPLDLEETREIANVRIHVERVIGALRQKYSILKGELPITMLRCNAENVRILDKIVVV